MSEEERRESEAWTPESYRRNQMWLMGMGAVTMTAMAGVLSSMSSPFEAAGGVVGPILASWILKRREPPPFGINRTAHVVPSFFFTEAYAPLRRQLRANVDTVRAPLFVALVVGAAWLAGWSARGGARPPFQVGDRGGLGGLLGEVFFFAMTGLLATQGAVGWAWLVALRRTPFTLVAALIVALVRISPALS